MKRQQYKRIQTNVQKRTLGIVSKSVDTYAAVTPKVSIRHFFFHYLAMIEGLVLLPSPRAQ